MWACVLEGQVDDLLPHEPAENMVVVGVCDWRGLALKDQEFGKGNAGTELACSFFFCSHELMSMSWHCPHSK